MRVYERLTRWWSAFWVFVGEAVLASGEAAVLLVELVESCFRSDPGGGE